MNDRSFTVRLADWTTDEQGLRAVRTRVFIEEQHVAPELEWDGFDTICTHVIAEHDGQPIATARLLPEGQIGRMAVLISWRRQGIGTALLERLIECALSLELDKVWLNAQSYAVPFYEKFGFNSEGKEFMEAGIPHRRMSRPLNR